MGKCIFAAAVSVLLSGCASNGPSGQTMALTPELRAATVAVLKNHLKDPYSVRDAQISPVVEAGVEGWAYGEWTWICAKLNSKNSFGAYTGMQVVAVGVRQGSDRYRYQFDPSFVCQGVRSWQPFPEMNGS